MDSSGTIEQKKTKNTKKILILIASFCLIALIVIFLISKITHSNNKPTTSWTNIYQTKISEEYDKLYKDKKIEGKLELTPILLTNNNYPVVLVEEFKNNYYILDIWYINHEDNVKILSTVSKNYSIKYYYNEELNKADYYLITEEENYLYYYNLRQIIENIESGSELNKSMYMVKVGNQLAVEGNILRENTSKKVLNKVQNHYDKKQNFKDTFQKLDKEVKDSFKSLKELKGFGNSALSYKAGWSTRLLIEDIDKKEELYVRVGDLYDLELLVESEVNIPDNSNTNTQNPNQPSENIDTTPNNNFTPNQNPNPNPNVSIRPNTPGINGENQADSNTQIDIPPEVKCKNNCPFGYEEDCLNGYCLKEQATKEECEKYPDSEFISENSSCKIIN